MQEFQDAQDRLRAVWPSGVNEILSARNPALLNELTKIEGVVESLLAIPNKPAPLRKQWREAIEQYEKTAMLCVVYAKRHAVQGN